MRDRSLAKCAPVWAVLALLAGAVPCLAQEELAALRPVLDDGQLLRKYVVDALGSAGAGSAAASAGFQQWRGAPEEWDRTPAGYAKRWASEYAAHAIAGAAKYGVAKALHHDPSFARCSCTGVAARLKHAVFAPFKARTRAGTWVWSPSSAAGFLAGELVPATTWYSEERGVGGGFAHASGAVAAKIGVNVLREFMPPRLLKFPPR